MSKRITAPLTDEQIALKRVANLAAVKRYQAANREKVRQSRASDYQKNREAKLAKHADYVEKNREKINAYNATRRAEKSDAYRKYAKRAREKNVDARKVWNQNRRAKKKALAGSISRDIAARLSRLQKGCCAVCRKKIDGGHHLDHIMPLALGGQHIDENIQLLCPLCNLKKSAKHPVDFMQSRGFLL